MGKHRNPRADRTKTLGGMSGSVLGSITSLVTTAAMMMARRTMDDVPRVGVTTAPICFESRDQLTKIIGKATLLRALTIQERAPRTWPTVRASKDWHMIMSRVLHKDPLIPSRTASSKPPGCMWAM